jgi:hypothetical protein
VAATWHWEGILIRSSGLRLGIKFLGSSLKSGWSTISVFQPVPAFRTAVINEECLDLRSELPPHGNIKELPWSAVIGQPQVLLPLGLIVPGFKLRTLYMEVYHLALPGRLRPINLPAYYTTNQLHLWQVNN